MVACVLLFMLPTLHLLTRKFSLVHLLGFVKCKRHTITCLYLLVLSHSSLSKKKKKRRLCFLEAFHQTKTLNHTNEANRTVALLKYWTRFKIGAFCCFEARCLKLLYILRSTYNVLITCLYSVRPKMLCLFPSWVISKNCLYLLIYKVLYIQYKFCLIDLN